MSLPEIHKYLTDVVGLHICQSHVGELFRLCLALVHCRDASNEALRAKLQEQGGIVVSADAVSFDESSAPLYVLRDVLSGEILAAKRLQLRGAKHLIPLFEEVRDLEVPVLGIISDKEKAIVNAAAKVFPEVPYQFCQVHFLSNLAIPMEHYAKQVGRGTKVVVSEIRDTERALLRQAERTRGIPKAEQEEHALALQLCRIVASVGKARGQKYTNPTALRRYERLERVAETTRTACERPGGTWPLLSKLLKIFDTLRTYADQAEMLEAQVNVIRSIASAFKMEETGLKVASAVKVVLEQLDELGPEFADEEAWSDFSDHVAKVSASFWPGLFHCYDHPKLPAHNNELEGFFGALKGLSRRVNGRQSTSGGPMETCAEFFVGAYDLLRNSDHPSLVQLLKDIPAEDLERARAEFAKLAAPAQRKRAIARDPELALETLLAQWSGVPPP